jgi:hypothetical protein
MSSRTWTLSITGRREWVETWASSARNSSGLPMVVPTIERAFRGPQQQLRELLG